MESINTGIEGFQDRLCELLSIQRCLLKMETHCNGRYLFHTNFHG